MRVTWCVARKAIAESSGLSDAPHHSGLPMPLSSSSRGFNGDLAQGRWRGTDCPYCGTFYARTKPQPNKLRESTQGETTSCGDCGHTAIVKWGKLECRDGGIFFVPDPGEDIATSGRNVPRVMPRPQNPSEETTRKHTLTREELEILRAK